MKKKKPKALSPSALALYESRPKEYFIRYCTHVPREKQKDYMCVGSAFDTIVKSRINEIFRLDENFSFEEEFERQVEPQNRDFALSSGQYLVECYKHSGLYNKLISLLNEATDIKFEKREIFTYQGVPLNCVPDLEFTLPGPRYVIHDFKVNGFCGKGKTTPQKGFVNITDGEAGKDSRGSGLPHNEAIPIRMDVGGKIFYHDARKNLLKSLWADQLRTYSWKAPGPDVIISVDQITGTKGHIRIAEHRSYMEDDGGELIQRYQELWELVNSDWFFRTLTEEESKLEQERLFNLSSVYEDEDFDWFKEMMGR